MFWKSRSLLLSTALLGMLPAASASAAPVDPFASVGKDPASERQLEAQLGEVRYSVDGKKAKLTITDAAGKKKRLDLPAPGTAVFLANNYLYVGCESGDMQMYTVVGKLAATPALVLEHKYPHAVTAFVVRNGEVMVAPPPEPEPEPEPKPEPEAGAEAAVPGADAGPSPAPAAVDPVEPPPEPEPVRKPVPQAVDEAPIRRVGSVASVEPNHVVIDLGSRDSLERGDHVELYREDEVNLGLGNTTTRHVTEAVGRVVDVSGGRARVELGIHEEVTEGARAIKTGEPISASPYAPKRVGNLLSVAMNFRPFLAWKARGAGALTDAAITYRFRKPAAIHLVAEPVGFGIAPKSTLAAVTAHGMASWDTRYFEFGAGLGWSIVEGNFQNNALAVPQFMRIGALDGVSVRVFNQFVLLQDRWAWGGTNVQGQFPIVGTAQRWWLQVGGGTGIAGYGFVEGGVKFLLWGGGDRNSFFLRGAAGYAQLEGNDGTNTVMVEADREQFSHRGPMATFGFEWRPGPRGAVGRNGAPDFGPSHKYGENR